VGNPVTNEREYLAGVADAAADDQAAVFQFLVDGLVRQQFASLKVVGGLGRDAEQHFGAFCAEPDIVVVVDLAIQLVVRLERVGADVQMVDAAQRKGFQSRFVGRYQIPDALVVDEPVGFQRASLVRIGEDAASVLPDGFVELAEVLVVGLERFVVARV
jgi:hypothetical protein